MISKNLISKTLITALLTLPTLLSGEVTFSMIKPTAVKEQKAGDIIAHIQKSGLKIVALKMAKITPAQAENLYQEHKEKPFYPGVFAYMTSGPVVMMVLEGDNAVLKARELIGATDPKAANPNTIRALFGKDRGDNAIHGSDSVSSAEREISIFFAPNEIYSQ